MTRSDDVPILLIQDDGSMISLESRCGPIERNRQAFADAGFAVALLDQTSTGGVGQPQDVAEAVRYLRARDRVPTWILGGSSSTEAVAINVTSLPATDPVGALFYSPHNLPASLTAMVVRPTLVVYHTEDRGQSGSALFAALTSAPIKERAALSGGNNNFCSNGFHLFNGIDAAFVGAVTGFIDKHNASFGAGAPQDALAVEFYNASLDHYFLTHVANEIALLDAGIDDQGLGTHRAVVQRLLGRGHELLAGVPLLHPARQGRFAFLRSRHDRMRGHGEQRTRRSSTRIRSSSTCCCPPTANVRPGRAMCTGCSATAPTRTTATWSIARFATR